MIYSYLLDSISLNRISLQEIRISLLGFNLIRRLICASIVITTSFVKMALWVNAVSLILGCGFVEQRPKLVLGL